MNWRQFFLFTTWYHNKTWMFNPLLFFVDCCLWVLLLTVICLILC